MEFTVRSQYVLLWMNTWYILVVIEIYNIIEYTAMVSFSWFHNRRHFLSQNKLSCFSSINIEQDTLLLL